MFGQFRFQCLLQNSPGQLFEQSPLAEHFVLGQPLEVDCIQQVVPLILFLFFRAFAIVMFTPWYFYLILSIYTNYCTGPLESTLNVLFTSLNVYPAS
jgi:hypothetical protein